MSTHFKFLHATYLLLFTASLSSQAYASRGNTSCSFSTDWYEHGANHPGWSSDFHYSYSNADILRAGAIK